MKETVFWVDSHGDPFWAEESEEASPVEAEQEPTETVSTETVAESESKSE